MIIIHLDFVVFAPFPNVPCSLYVGICSAKVTRPYSIAFGVRSSVTTLKKSLKKIEVHIYTPWRPERKFEDVPDAPRWEYDPTVNFTIVPIALIDENWLFYCIFTEIDIQKW